MIRIDKYLAENNDNLTRSQAVILIESGNCTVNGKTVAKNYKVGDGDVVELTLPEPEKTDILPEDIELDIRYEDDYVIVVNKPRGMVVHPAPKQYSGTLVNALMYYCQKNGSGLSGINGVIRPGIVHRLDKDTSGLIAIAKNDVAHLSLSEQLKSRTMTREYRAIVHGCVKADKDTVNAPIGRSVSDRKKMCVTNKNAREAVTHYEVIERYDKFTYVKLNLQTGRTHQIRVHLSYIGHPVAGDCVYTNGNNKIITSLNGQCLHAKRLTFIHPVSGEQITAESELPCYFTDFMEQIGGFKV